MKGRARAIKPKTRRTFRRASKLASSLLHCKQIDDVSIHDAFPGLGQKVYVTFNDKPWRNPAEKQANEKWVNVYIGDDGMAEHFLRSR